MILVVDDEKDIAEMISEMIRSSFPRKNVIAVTEANHCLSLARDNPAELILLDILMPNRNGIELLRELRTFSKIPVIIISSITELFEDEIKDFSDVYFMEKPFE